MDKEYEPKNKSQEDYNPKKVVDLTERIKIKRKQKEEKILKLFIEHSERLDW